jgi:hypothetical protein
MTSPITPDELKQLRALCEKATAGPWMSDLDQFDHDEIDACVSDEQTTMLARIGTGVVPLTVPDGVPWSQAIDEQSKSLWSKARCSQARTDADFIAAARTALPRLLDERERSEGGEVNVECTLCGSATALTGSCRGCGAPAAIEGRSTRRYGKAEGEKLRAEVERMRAEIERLRAIDASNVGDMITLSDVNATLRAECERMRPVYEAAKEMRARGGYYNDVRDRLFAAVDVAIAKEAAS